MALTVMPENVIIYLYTLQIITHFSRLDIKRQPDPVKEDY